MAKEQGVFLDIRILSFLRHWTFDIRHSFFEIFIRVYWRDSRTSLVSKFGIRLPAAASCEGGSFVSLCVLCGEMIGAIHLSLERFRELGSIASCRGGSTIPIRVRPLAESPFAPNFATKCVFLGIPKKSKNNC